MSNNLKRIDYWTKIMLLIKMKIKAMSSNKTSELTPDFLAEKTWDLYQTFGVPIEVSEDILASKGLKLNQDLLQELIESHQKNSKSESAVQFKSGVASGGDKTKALHTLTHVLHQVLRDTFGIDVRQIGSAITDQKARFDSTIEASKITSEKIAELEIKVNEIISKKLKMEKIETTPENARDLGAIGLFGEKYGEIVSIYTLQDENGTVYSREFCGGPHVKNTDQIGKFVILKKKSIGNGQTRLEFDLI
jgi:alanyl-tRNA synthetase